MPVYYTYGQPSGGVQSSQSRPRSSRHPELGGARHGRTGRHCSPRPTRTPRGSRRSFRYLTPRLGGPSGNAVAGVGADVIGGIALKLLHNQFQQFFGNNANVDPLGTVLNFFRNKTPLGNEVDRPTARAEIEKLVALIMGTLPGKAKAPDPGGGTSSGSQGTFSGTIRRPVGGV